MIALDASMVQADASKDGAYGIATNWIELRCPAMTRELRSYAAGVPEALGRYRR